MIMGLKEDGREGQGSEVGDGKGVLVVSRAPCLRIAFRRQESLFQRAKVKVKVNGECYGLRKRAQMLATMEVKIVSEDGSQSLSSLARTRRQSGE